MATATLAATDLMTHFKPRTLEHLVCVLACVALMVAVAVLGRRARGTPAGDRMRQAVAWVGIAYWLGSNAWWMWGPQYSFAQSLPLQVCDLAGLIGPLALLTRKRWLRAVLYFWGLSLSVQGFIQPVLKDRGLMHVEFWLFWANHTTIVGTALYDVVALGFRPTRRDFLIALGASLAYIAAIVPFDLIFGVNYGYVGPKDPIPHEPTLADKLGPWPLNALLMTLLGMAAMALIWLPWEVVRRSRHAQGSVSA